MSTDNEPRIAIGPSTTLRLRLWRACKIADLTPTQAQKLNRRANFDILPAERLLNECELRLHMYSEQNSASGDRGGKSFAIALAIVVSLAAVLTILIRQTIEVDQFSTGTPAPKIQVAGWLNGPGPTAEELHGKVIVVDAWAFWCGPCRREAPELVKLYEKYKDRVVFIGLTSEGIEADAANREFLKQTKITWPNGYGAVQTLTELKAEFIPQRWVIDRKYNLVWNENSPESIEAAIDSALAQKP